MNKLLYSSKAFLKRNGSIILTCLGAAGTVATAVTAVKATPKALEAIKYAEEEKGEKLTKLEIVNVAGPAYIPTALTATATVACIFGANVLNTRKQAALISAYTLLDNSYKEYKDKVKELYGEDADENVKNELAKDKYDQNAHKVVDPRKNLYFDEYSSRYFEASTEDMLRVENEINRRMMSSAGMFLNEYFILIGLEPTDYGDFMGWSSCELYDMHWESWFNLEFRKEILPDGLEVIIVTFEMDPTFDFENYY